MHCKVVVRLRSRLGLLRSCDAQVEFVDGPFEGAERRHSQSIVTDQRMPVVVDYPELTGRLATGQKPHD